MVHKRYEKRGGKVFGPYYYESYRVGNKVKKRYIGGEKEYRVWLGDKNKKELKKSRTTSYFSVINKGKHFSFILVGLFFFLLILFLSPSQTLYSFSPPIYLFFTLFPTL